jgi:hypothetical protein
MLQLLRPRAMLRSLLLKPKNGAARGANKSLVAKHIGNGVKRHVIRTTHVKYNAAEEEFIIERGITEVRLRSNRHAKKFPRLSGLRGV